MTLSIRQHHRLDATTFVRLRGPLTVSVEAGTVWVTQDGSPLDLLLEPGEARHLDGSAPIMLGTLRGTAVARVSPPNPSPGWGARLTALLPRLGRASA